MSTLYALVPAQGVWFFFLAALVQALLLFRFRPHDLATVRNTLLLALVAGPVASFVSAIFMQLDMAKTASFLGETGYILSGITLIRMSGLTLFRLVLPALRTSVPRITEDLVVVACYLGWGIVRLRYAGVNFGELVTASAVITAVIAFSMQDTLGNILGGIALQLDDSLQLGDWVKIDDLVGKVTEVRWRSTSLLTRNGEIVCLPNSQLMRNRFLVLGRRKDGPPQWRRWVHFETPNDVFPAQVIQVVQDALHSSHMAGVSKEIMPDCVLLGLQSGLCQFAVRYWLTDLQRDDPTDSQIRIHTLAALRRANIALALPQLRVRSILENEEAESFKHQQEIDRRVAVLERTNLFKVLTLEERQTLARRLHNAPYAAGSTIVRQGAVGDCLYILTGGEVEILIALDDGGTRRVNTLKAGDFFGEMALMTGEPRGATVLAKTDVDSYRLSKQAFADLLHGRPELADEISQILVDRQSGIDSTLEESRRQSRDNSGQCKELLSRIRQFFGISET